MCEAPAAARSQAGGPAEIPRLLGGQYQNLDNRDGIDENTLFVVLVG